MRALRRYDYSPRIELTPLIDVVLLILTFFIYSVAMMIRAQVMPVKLTPLDPAAAVAAGNAPGRIDAVTVTNRGQLFYNNQPVSPAEFKARLSAMALRPAGERPRLFLAMQAPDDPARAQPVDRGPLLIGLIGQIQAAGISNFTIVGQETSPVAPPVPLPQPGDARP